MRTLLLGIDGLDPELVDKFDLPNIESVGDGFEIDTHGNSGPSWASVLTGLTPDGHGVRKLRPQQNIQTWQGTPIWEKIRGYSGIANVPLTYPVDKDIDGWMISSMMTPKDAIYAYPRSVYKKLEELGYRVDIWTSNHKNHPDGTYGAIKFEFTQEYRDNILNQAEEVVEKRGDSYVWLINNEPVDFAFLCFTVLDRVSHIAFNDKDVMEKFYKLVDNEVGRILDNLSDDCEIFLNSDHGFQVIDMPRTDMKGEHRFTGYGATNTDVYFRNLESLHRKVVESANRNDNVEQRLDDLGYLD